MSTKRNKDIFEYFHTSLDEFDEFCHELKKNHYNSKHLIITVVDKVGHPWEERISGPLCFAVDGSKGKTIHLEKDKRYFITFKDLSEKYHLIFTHDPAGGFSTMTGVSTVNGTSTNIKSQNAPTETSVALKQMHEDIEPLSGFKTISFVTDEKFPDIFYYQDVKEPFLGGPIIIKEKSKTWHPFPKDIERKATVRTVKPKETNNRDDTAQKPKRKSTSSEKPRRRRMPLHGSVSSISSIASIRKPTGKANKRPVRKPKKDDNKKDDDKKAPVPKKDTPAKHVTRNRSPKIRYVTKTRTDTTAHKPRNGIKKNIRKNETDSDDRRRTDSSDNRKRNDPKDKQKNNLRDKQPVREARPKDDPKDKPRDKRPIRDDKHERDKQKDERNRDDRRNRSDVRNRLSDDELWRQERLKKDRRHSVKERDCYPGHDNRSVLTNFDDVEKRNK